jgi:hypothetical protein
MLEGRTKVTKQQAARQGQPIRGVEPGDDGRKAAKMCKDKVIPVSK